MAHTFALAPTPRRLWEIAAAGGGAVVSVRSLLLAVSVSMVAAAPEMVECFGEVRLVCVAGRGWRREWPRGLVPLRSVAHAPPLGARPRPAPAHTCPSRSAQPNAASVGQRSVKTAEERLILTKIVRARPL